MHAKNETIETTQTPRISRYDNLKQNTLPIRTNTLVNLANH